MESSLHITWQEGLGAEPGGGLAGRAVRLCTPQARLIGRLIYPAGATLPLGAILPAARALADCLVESIQLPLPMSIAETLAQLEADLQAGRMDCVILPLTPEHIRVQARQMRRRYPAEQLVEHFATLLEQRAPQTQPGSPDQAIA